MKKALISAIMALVMAVPAFAQFDDFREDHRVYYGLRLGLGLSTVNSDDDLLDGGSTQAGLVLGATIGFQLSPAAPVYLESGMLYTQKGGKGKYEGKKFTYDLNYLEMPIVVKYRYEIDSDLSIQPFGGGYLAVGIGGKVKNYGDRQSESSFSSNYFKRFDGGLRIGCGAEYQIIYAEIAYDFGLANICHDDFDKSRNGCFYFNVGVNF